MTDVELLTKVKTALLIGGTYHDEMLKIYIDEVKDFLKSAGVAAEILQSEKIVGIVSRGVSDLWNMCILILHFTYQAFCMSNVLSYYM